MNLKKLLPLAILGLLIFNSCHRNDDETEITPVDAQYELILENNTEREVEIFLQGLTGSEDFDRRGLIGPGEEMRLELYVEQTYVIRAAYPGSSPEDHFYEQTLNRSSNTPVTLLINSP